MNKFLIKNLNTVLFSLLLLLGLAYLDYITGYDLGFFVFYFIPISIVAWYSGKQTAITISFLAAIAWLLVDQYSAHPYSNWSYPYWNAFVRWTSFVILALTISKIQFLLEKEKQLKCDLTKALDKINQHIAVAKRVAEGDLSLALPSINSQSEAIDETFRFMIKRLAEQKNLEKRLFDLERQAIMAETASHLAHEIRNPLNLIMLTTHHLGNQFVPPEETKKSKFNDLILSLKSEVEQLSNVITNFMAMGKPSELKKISFPISEIIDQIQILIKQQLLSKNISMECYIEENLKIFADPEQIKLVVLNLIVNATAAVTENGTIQFYAQCDGAKNIVRLAISDNGTGIMSDDLERVFEPYFTRKIDGTGLGLALVKRIIDDHNGSICAYNNSDKGARFEIILPLEEKSCRLKS